MTASRTGRLKRRSGGPAYAALLAATTLGTLTSTLIAAPLNVIGEEIGASPQEMVLALTVFTLALVVLSPVAGWICDRVGATRALTVGLALMGLFQLVAAFTQHIAFLIVLRILLGAACAVIPPSVQRTLVRLWPKRRRRVMAAWASSMGVGQALGPPLGGLLADLIDWRAVFWVHGGLCLLVASVLLLTVPSVSGARSAFNTSGFVSLIVGGGSLAIAMVGVGTGMSAAVVTGLVVAGAVGMLSHVALAFTSPRPLLQPKYMFEPLFIRTTFGAGSVMATLGVVIVAVPLYLGRVHGMPPSTIGMTVLGLAGAMTIASPIASRIADQTSAWATLLGGFIVLTAAMAVLTVVADGGNGPLSYPLFLALLVLAGGGLGAVQALSSDAMMGTPSAGFGVALGMHNMARFTGLVAGYSWAALAFEVATPGTAYLGVAVLGVVGTLLFLLPPGRIRRAMAESV